MLAGWTATSQNAGDTDAELLKEIRRDIQAASNQLRRSELLGRVGGLITMISLPIGAYEAMHGGSLGFALTPVGGALESYRFLKSHKASWMRFGSAQSMW
jgi:hypothetical protein